MAQQPGDPVKQDETVLEIATDKVDSEVPSTTDGIIDQVLFTVNDVVPVGAVIARIRTTAAEPAGVSQPPYTPESHRAQQEPAAPPREQKAVLSSAGSNG